MESNSRKRYDDDEEDYHSIYIRVPSHGATGGKGAGGDPPPAGIKPVRTKGSERQDRSNTDEGGQANYDNGNNASRKTHSSSGSVMMDEDDGLSERGLSNSRNTMT
ncbi:unnamed protein product [Caretta caretta]